MELNKKQVRHLKSLAHKLSPVVTVGKGRVSENVVLELKSSLKSHELVKVKVRCEDQEEMKELVQDLLQGHQAHLVGIIGHTVILYQQSDEQKIKLPS